MSFKEFWEIDATITGRIVHSPKGGVERECLYSIRYALGVFFDTLAEGCE